MFALGRAFLTTPIGLAVAGIAIAALLIYKYWKPIKAFFAGFWAGLKQGLAPLQPQLDAIAAAVSADSLREFDAALVGFGTRHTLSDTKSDHRGIGAARRWVKAQFERFSADCGGCLEVVTPAQAEDPEEAADPFAAEVDLIAGELFELAEAPD